MADSSNPFQGKLAIVTGAGRGIGRAITHSLVQRGCHVIAIGYRQESLTECKELAPDPALVSTLVINVADWKATSELLPPAIADKSVHYLVNNVANIVREPFGQISEAVMDKHYDEILKSTVNVTQIVVERMKHGAGGAIVNMGSLSSLHSPPPGMLVYGICKAGLNHLTRLLAVELAPYKIRVNGIIPGVVDTPEIQNLPPEAKAMVMKKIGEAPIGRLSTPQEIADGTLFLLADTNASLTGVNLRMEGGRSQL